MDDVNDEDPVPLEFCGDDENPEAWESSSNMIVLNFVSDAIGTAGGFTIVATFQDCPDPPPFVYELGEYGEVRTTKTCPFARDLSGNIIPWIMITVKTMKDLWFMARWHGDNLIACWFHQPFTGRNASSFNVRNLSSVL